MENKKRIFKRFGVGWIALFMFVVGVVPAHADFVTVDQILCEGIAGCTGLSGTVHVSVAADGRLQIIVTNTTVGTVAGSNNRLTSIGFQMAATIEADGSSLAAGPNSGPFDDGFNDIVSDGADLADFWGFSNVTPGSGYYTGLPPQNALPVDHVLATMQGADIETMFNGDPENGTALDGVDYGIVSQTGPTTGQPYVQDSIVFLLDVGGQANATAAAAAIAAGNVILGFASPNTGVLVPEPSTYALYALGISMLFLSGWWQKRRKQQGDMAAF